MNAYHRYPESTVYSEITPVGGTTFAVGCISSYGRSVFQVLEQVTRQGHFIYLDGGLFYNTREAAEKRIQEIVNKYK